MDNHEFSPYPESPKSAESLAAQLGFIETTELYDLRLDISRKFLEDYQRAVQLKDYYQALAQEMVNESQGESYVKTQIALLLMLASIKKGAGLIDDYRAELADAADYAYAMNFYDLVDRIDSLLADD